MQDAVVWSAASFISQGLGFAADVVISRALGPAMRGLWELLQIVLSYGDYSNLGVRSAAGRDIPVRLGAGDVPGAERLARVTFGFNQTTAVIAMVLLLVASLVLPRETPPLVVWGIRAGAVILFLQQWYAFYLIQLRSYRRFGMLGRVHVLKALLALAVQGTLATLYGLPGLLAGAIGAYVLLLLYVRPSGPPALAWRLGWSEARPLLRAGLPFLVIGLSVLAFTSADRILISSFLDVTALGYYSVATLTASVLAFVPNAVSTIMHPRIFERFGADRSAESLVVYLHYPTRVIAGVQGVITANLILLLPLAVQILLPHFLPGVAAARIMAIGAFFAALTQLPATVLLANRIWGYQVGLIANAVVGGILVLLSLLRGWGIEGVAGAVAIGHALRFISFTGYAFGQVADGARRLLGLLSVVLLPALWSGAAFWVAIVLLPDGRSVEPATVILRLLSLNILLAPLVVWLLRDTNLWPILGRPVRIGPPAPEGKRGDKPRM